jgi:hypothetical protein
VQQRLFQFAGIRERCGFQIRGTAEVSANVGAWDALYVEPTFPTSFAAVEIVRPTIPTQVSVGGWPADTPTISNGLVNFTTMKGWLGDTIPGVDVNAAAVDTKTTSQADATFSSKGGALALSVSGLGDYLSQVKAVHANAMTLQSSPPQPKVSTTVMFNADTLTLGFAADILNCGVLSYDDTTKPGGAKASGVVQSSNAVQPNGILQYNGGVVSQVVAWQPTCNRWVSVQRITEGLFGPLEHEIVGFPDVGTLGMGASTSNDPSELIVHDVLLRYANDSPVVQGRKKSFRGKDRALDIVARTSVPREVTLPEIHYGSRYAVRLRAVDITGVTRVGDNDQTAWTQYTDGDNPPSNALNSNVADLTRLSPLQPPVLNRPHHESSSSRVDQITLLMASSGTHVDEGQAWRRIEPPRVPSIVAEMHGMLSDPQYADALEQYLRARPSGKPISYPDPLAKGIRIVFLGPDGVRQSFRAYYLGTWPEIKPLYVRMDIRRDLPRPHPWRVTATDDGFLVSVLPGIEVTAQMSSISHSQRHTHLKLLHPNVLRADFDDPTTKVPISRARTATYGALGQENESVITRARKLALVAATKIPAWQPTLVAPPTATRVPGDKSAEVCVEMNFPVFSADQLEIRATWPDWRIGADGKTPERYDRSRVITTQTVSQRPQELALITWNDTLDTRRRDVRYSFFVRSRYVGLFAPEDATHFLTQVPPSNDPASLNTGLVTLKNTVQPKKLAVDRISTTFEWTSAGKRTRSPGTVRMYFNGDLHLTGDGEQVGIVLNPTPKVPPPGPVPFSWIGQDPLFATSGTPITNANLMASQLLGSAGPPKSVGLVYYDTTTFKKALTTVTILPFDPHFDARDGRWYVDLTVIEPVTGDTSSYMPFVGLAVCRYQPMSLHECHLSEVLELPTFQPLPKRSATTTVKWIGEQRWQVDVKLEASQFAVTTQRHVRVSLDRKRFPVVDPHAGSELIWEPDDDLDRAFTTIDATPGAEHYQAILNLPYPRGFRVRIAESELYELNDVIRSTPRPRLVYIDVTDDLETLVRHRTPVG